MPRFPTRSALAALLSASVAAALRADAAVEVAHALAQHPAPLLAPPARKVLAHYHWFTRSIDDMPRVDYYDCWQTPQCEGGKYAGSGGYLLDRPVYRAPLPGSDWQTRDKAWEVATARANGIDGFLFNLVSVDPSDATLGGWPQLAQMLDAAAQAGGGTFKIVPNVDASGISASQAGLVHTRLADIVSNPSVMHLADGRAVVGAYMPEAWPDAAWATALAGLNVAFVPTFLRWQNGYGSRVPQTYAEAVWGASDPSRIGVSTIAAEAHGQGRLFMAPVRPQDARPKDLVYWEPLGPSLFIGMWNQAIANGDWVQVVTWNDYGENTHVEPSDGVGEAWLKLGKRYSDCFHGACPAATDDIYYFQRVQSVNAQPGPLQSQLYTRLGGTVGDDHVWLFGFLKAPGTFQITCGSQVWTASVAADAAQLLAPVVDGCTPDYQLIRSATTVKHLEGFPISNAIDYQRLAYRAGTTAP